jgi:hypothetical protein
MKKGNWVVQSLVSVTVSMFLGSEPLIAEERPEGRVWSDWIVVAEDLGSEKAEPTKERCWIIRVLRGPPSGRSLIDVSNVKRDESNKSSLPATGAKWIIFIPSALPENGTFQAYLGANGSVKYSRQSLDNVLDEIQQAFHECYDEKYRQKLDDTSAISILLGGLLNPDRCVSRWILSRFLNE